MLNELGGGQVADIGKCDPVAETGHAVSTAGAGIGAGQRGKLGLGRNVVHGAQRVIQRQADGRTGGGDMLEAGGGGLAQRLFMSRTSCQEFRASIKLMYPGRPFKI